MPRAAARGIVRLRRAWLITSSTSISASDAPNPVASQVCPNPQWTVVNVRKTFTGEFDLFAVVHHQDGSETRIESEF
jgi:hypothetical protein